MTPLRSGPHHRTILRRLVLLAALSVAWGAQAAEPPLRLLFIGNSLTYSNDLPAMVKRLGTLAKRTVTVSSAAQPDFSLEDHLVSRATAREIGRGGWDVVILQQGPSSLDSSRQQLLRDAAAMAARVRARSPRARIALLMVWPDVTRFAAMPRVAESYRLTAQAVNGVLIPAGNAISVALRTDPSLPLLSSDGFHPAPAGTWLMALATWVSIAGPLPPDTWSPAAASRVAGADLALTQLQLDRLRDALAAAVPSEEPPAGDRGQRPERR